MNTEHMNLWERFKGRFKEDAKWFELYVNVKEDIPVYAHFPHGKEVEIKYWVYENHAGDCKTHCGHTVVLVCINLAPMVWYLKIQSPIESSTFGLEVVAMNTCLELVKELRYKLRIMGMPIDGLKIFLR